ncbi:MAG: NAD(P)-dependent oxidoreductase, partial [Planctomycetota bacterium]
PTHHLLNADRLAAMKPGGWLFNACRGGVVDSAVLAEALEDGPPAGAVLDVYEDEPTPLKKLVRRARLATPHIAGYAIEGRRRATTMVYHAICDHIGAEPADTEPMLSGEFSPPQEREVTFQATGEPRLDADNALRALLRETYDIERVTREFRETLDEPDRGEAFDRLRNLEGSGRRHELRSYRAAAAPGAAPQLRRELRGRLRGLRMPLDPDTPDYILRPTS